jgi:hypothetical protein
MNSWSILTPSVWTTYQFACVLAVTLYITADNNQNNQHSSIHITWRWWAEDRSFALFLWRLYIGLVKLAHKQNYSKLSRIFFRTLGGRPRKMQTVRACVKNRRYHIKSKRSDVNILQCLRCFICGIKDTNTNIVTTYHAMQDAWVVWNKSPPTFEIWQFFTFLKII